MSRMAGRASYSLLYDGDCRICSAFARAIRSFDVRRTLDVRRIQESRDLLAAIPAAHVLDSAHAVSPDGRVSSGADAMPALLAALVADPAFEERLRGSRRSMAFLGAVYEVMRTVRGRLACAAPASAGRSPR